MRLDFTEHPAYHPCFEAINIVPALSVVQQIFLTPDQVYIHMIYISFKVFCVTFKKNYIYSVLMID